MQPVTIEDSVIASGGVVDIVPKVLQESPVVATGAVEDARAEQHKAETKAALQELHQNVLQWQAEVQAYRDRRNRAINEAGEDD